MALTPETEYDINNINYVSYPTKSFLFDENTKHLIVSNDNNALMEQTIETILQVERFSYEIFTDNVGTQKVDLPGLDKSVIINMLQGRIRNALSIDDRIIGVSNFEYEIEGKTKLIFSFVANTIFGDYEEEVSINI